ncbi:hypothetical protein SAMN05192588_2779 [Nonlabens sp. Hel1_33_55]|uniref:dihydrolipoamide dehydrogenase n=1 Tax=Nonlabens sp. Hel1_33_55 TaxID=1336802 RepID=UPI000875E181|nr:dihydrolipoamide dehydrogenase [Nonlabens sp. Hel1_33_55]SCY41884.1 hypothetical protein SAMN05192588_2779 [Nonlabens sp. Hel1_33_55]
MKKIILLLAIAVGFASCEGDQGPAGFDGLDGLDAETALIFETTVDFAAPDYSVPVNYPDNFELFDTDVVLAFILFEDADTDDGRVVDVWRALPQTIFSDFGDFRYNYDFTIVDARLFIDGPASTNFDNLTTADVNNQTFRFVILPSEFASDPRLDVNDFNSVMNIANLNSSDIIQIQK